MTIPEFLIALVAIMGPWGALWFRIGNLTREVKEHNLKLDVIQKQLERIITGKGG